MSKFNGIENLNRIKLLMGYQNDKTLTENTNLLLHNSNSNKNFVISDMATPDMKYLILFDEMYDVKQRKSLGNFWDSFDNIKLFLEHGFPKIKEIPIDIRENYLREVKSLVLNESTMSNDLLILKENFRIFLKEGLWDFLGSVGTGISQGLSTAANVAGDVLSYGAQSVKDLVTTTGKAVYNVGKGIYQGVSAIMRGDLKMLWNLLTKGALYLARYVRQLMYNPIASIIDALLVFTGVGKAVQWIPWAIIVALDVYEVINNDYENKLPEGSEWMRFIMIGCDILGLVTTGAAAITAKGIIKTLQKMPVDDVAKYLANNPSMKATIERMIGGVAEVPSFLQKAVDKLKPWLPSVANFISGILQHAANALKTLSFSFKKMLTKTFAKVATKEFAVDYGANKAIEGAAYAYASGQSGQSAQSAQSGQSGQSAQSAKSATAQSATNQQKTNFDKNLERLMQDY